MSIEINLKNHPTAVLTITVELPPTAAGATNQRIVAARSAIEQLRLSRQTIPTADSLYPQLDELVSKATEGVEVFEKKAGDSATILAAITATIADLTVAVELLGTQASEASIQAEAVARKANIDAEVEKKLAALAVIEK